MKTAIEWVKGIPVKNVTMKETLEQIEYWIQTKRTGYPPAYVATVNLDYLVNCQSKTETGRNLKSFLGRAEWVIADGKPVVWLSKWFGNGLKERVAGSDLVPLLGSVSVEKKWKIFVVGGNEQSLLKTTEKWIEEHGASALCGMYCGKIDLSDKESENEIVDQINKSNADIVLIALGSPKQEKWFTNVKSKLNVSVAIGVGGTFEMVSGNVKRAPKWVQNIGAEWIVRFIQEPTRLFKRYLTDGIWLMTWIIRGLYGLFLLKVTSLIYDISNNSKKSKSFHSEINSVLDKSCKILTGYEPKSMKFINQRNYSGKIFKYGLQKYLEIRFCDENQIINNVRLQS